MYRFSQGSAFTIPSFKKTNTVFCISVYVPRFLIPVKMAATKLLCTGFHKALLLQYHCLKKLIQCFVMCPGLQTRDLPTTSSPRHPVTPSPRHPVTPSPRHPVVHRSSFVVHPPPHPPHHIVTHLTLHTEYHDLIVHCHSTETKTLSILFFF